MSERDPPSRKKQNLAIVHLKQKISGALFRALILPRFQSPRRIHAMSYKEKICHLDCRSRRKIVGVLLRALTKNRRNYCDCPLETKKLRCPPQNSDPLILPLIQSPSQKNNRIIISTVHSKTKIFGPSQDADNQKLWRYPPRKCANQGLFSKSETLCQKRTLFMRELIERKI